MQIRFHCPTDLCVAVIQFEPLEEAGPTIECPRCHQRHSVTLTDAIRQEERVDRCSLCGCRELFVRKDFPQFLGFLIVVAAGLVSIFTLKTHTFISWGVLVGAVLVDMVIYYLVGVVTVCYACRAEYRRCALDPAHQGFDLARSEKY